MPSLSLIKLFGAGTFQFDLFPKAVTTEERVNWEPQNTTIGVKPLFYANRDPRQLRFDELWLDQSDTRESLTPMLKELRALCEETEQGTPAPLLVAWGDRQERCVLQTLEIEEQFFDYGGQPLRARVKLTLLQFQPARERASARVRDDASTGDGPEP